MMLCHDERVSGSTISSLWCNSQYFKLREMMEGSGNRTTWDLLSFNYDISSFLKRNRSKEITRRPGDRHIFFDCSSFNSP
jgi:hypothetical protein